MTCGRTPRSRRQSRATSKRVRTQLAQRLQAAVQVVCRASIESVAKGLLGILACASQLVRIDWDHRCRTDGTPIGDRCLAGMLRECSSLAVPNLWFNDIGAEGVRCWDQMLEAAPRPRMTCRSSALRRASATSNFSAPVFLLMMFITMMANDIFKAQKPSPAFLCTRLPQIYGAVALALSPSTT